MRAKKMSQQALPVVHVRDGGASAEGERESLPCWQALRGHIGQVAGACTHPGKG